MNRIQSKYHTIGTYEIKKISLSCFDEKYISKTMNTIDQVLVIKVNYKNKKRKNKKMKKRKIFIKITIQKSFLVEL